MTGATSIPLAHRGFTFVEVVFIIGILAAIILIVLWFLNVLLTFRKGRDTERQMYAKDLGNAMFQTLIGQTKMAGAEQIEEGVEHAFPFFLIPLLPFRLLHESLCWYQPIPE
jgi:hypothetical protein